MIKVQRIYDFDKHSGFRILVDRLWPRGVSKDKVDLWFSEIAPGNKLRKWFNHEFSKWDEFKERYFEELKGKKDLVDEFLEVIRGKKNVVLLYSAKDEAYNNAAALLEFLDSKSL